MKIWLYYAKAGGGHKAPAEALARDLARLYPESESKLIDLADKALFLFRFLLDSGYVYMTHKLSWIYALLFWLSRWRPIIAIEYWLSDLAARSSIKAELVVDSPDGIIATHFLISPLRSALRELGKKTPIIVLVTDPFSVSPVWFYYRDLKYIVYSEQAKKIALDCGIPESNVFIMHQIMNHEVCSFGVNEAKKIKKEFGLDETKKLILMIGGGNGLPKAGNFFEEILKSNIDANVVAVCGTNIRQFDELKDISDKLGRKSVILGWINNLNSLMAVSDVVITKAGAGVIFESLMNRKPIIISHYIYGQEKGTVDFIVNNQFGYYESNPKNLPSVINRVLENNSNNGLNKPINIVSGNDEVVNYVVRVFSESNP